MKKLMFFLCMFLFLATISASERVPVTLNDCVDGDTVWFNIDDEKVKFRFLGIDTPESVHPKKSVELYGKDASEYTCNLLSNATKIEVEYDKKSQKKDKYDRHLAWIWIDDVLLQQNLIKIGYAQVAYIYGDYKYVEDLCAEQQQAILNKEGIWSKEREIGYCSKIDFSKGSLMNKKTYKVIFSDAKENVEVMVVEGALLKERKVESKDGKIFKGWYLNGSKYNFNTPITESIVLEARYEIDYLYLALLVGLLITSLIVKKQKKRRR